MMPDDEERLAALIDNELDEDEKSALLARLAQDEALRKRLEALRQDRARLVASFDALLEQAPLARLRAAIPAADLDLPLHPKGARSAGSSSQPKSRSAFCLRARRHGSNSAAFWAPRGKPGSMQSSNTWSSTRPTRSRSSNPDSAVQARQLQAVSAKVGVDLTPDKVAVPGLRYRTAFNFSYDGEPLAEIAYTDAGGAPVLFCVIANGKPRRAAANWWRAKGCRMSPGRAGDAASCSSDAYAGAAGRRAGAAAHDPVLN